MCAPFFVNEICMVGAYCVPHTWNNMGQSQDKYCTGCDFANYDTGLIQNTSASLVLTLAKAIKVIHTGEGSLSWSSSSSVVTGISCWKNFVILAIVQHVCAFMCGNDFEHCDEGGSLLHYMGTQLQTAFPGVGTYLMMGRLLRTLQYIHIHTYMSYSWPQGTYTYIHTCIHTYVHTCIHTCYTVYQVIFVNY